MARLLLNRRDFLEAAGLPFLNMLFPNASEAFEDSEELFASAIQRGKDEHAILLFDKFGRPLTEIGVPARGHGLTHHPASKRLVLFARRPGTFALILSLDHTSSTSIISAPDSRHFYGHGAFSPDGKLLYASENDFGNAKGVVGVYDATNEFERLGEFSSFGIGPHEIKLIPGTNTLVVANGGIETHPDFGRAKLNLSTMQPSLCFVDAITGNLLERHVLPSGLHQLSIRHMDISQAGTVYFGCQYEGVETSMPPLFGDVQLGSEMRLWPLGSEVIGHTANYVGSVALDKEEDQVAFTMPKSNRILIASTMTKKSVWLYQKESAFGVAPSESGFITTSSQGVIDNTTNNSAAKQNDLRFDNHLLRLR